ncbi:WD40-repeat-containing domain protein [Baffinella frigidus]|nr:WD40-repeat-containing domain protein [Cryptophyta sp. CCMP2293]
MSSGGIDVSGLEKKEDNDVLFIGFNQDQSCLAVGVSKGFKVFNCSPFHEQVNSEMEGGGIRLVEMLFRCNIFALVGAADNTRFPPNQVIIWDDKRKKDIGQLSFRHDVKAVRLRRDKVVVVLEYKVLVFNFSDLSQLMEIDTISNPKGLCALCPAPNHTVLACPGTQKGQVRLELSELRRTFSLAAHTAALSCLALTLDGTRLATASEKGTILRVFDTLTGKLLQEVRRGAQAADICGIAFSPTSSLLSCASVRGTVHIFSLAEAAAAAQTNGEGRHDDVSGEKKEQHAASNCRSSLSFMGSVVNYFNSEWSFARFRLPGTAHGNTICSFASDPNTILVVTASGQVHSCTFKPDGAAGQECEAGVSCSFVPEKLDAATQGGAGGVDGDAAALAALLIEKDEGASGEDEAA